PYGVDRGVEMVPGGEMVLVTVGFAHAIAGGSGREKSLGKRYVGLDVGHVDGLDRAIPSRKAFHSERKQGVLRQPHLVAMHAGYGGPCVAYDIEDCGRPPGDFRVVE